MTEQCGNAVEEVGFMVLDLSLKKRWESKKSVQIWEFLCQSI